MRSYVHGYVAAQSWIESSGVWQTVTCLHPLMTAQSSHVTFQSAIRRGEFIVSVHTAADMYLQLPILLLYRFDCHLAAYPKISWFPVRLRHCNAYIFSLLGILYICCTVSWCATQGLHAMFSEVLHGTTLLMESHCPD